MGFNCPHPRCCKLSPNDSLWWRCERGREGEMEWRRKGKCRESREKREGEGGGVKGWMGRREGGERGNIGGRGVRKEGGGQGENRGGRVRRRRGSDTENREGGGG